jgi:hypothetical protein
MMGFGHDALCACDVPDCRSACCRAFPAGALAELVAQLPEARMQGFILLFLPLCIACLTFCMLLCVSCRGAG